MQGVVDDVGPVHDVQRGLAMVAQGLQLALGARTWSLSPREVRDALAAAAVYRRQADALVLQLVRASLAQDAGQTPGRETRQWLQANLRVTAGQARALVENAALADPETGTLARVGRELATGRIGAEHLDAARRALAKVPDEKVRTRAEEIDRTLAERLPALDGRQAAVACQHLAATLAPAREDHLDAFLRERRYLDYALSDAGVLRGTFLLEGLDAVTAKGVLDHLAAPGRDTDAQDEQLPGTADSRTLAQRRADALAAALRLAQGSDGAGTRSGEPPHLLVHTTVEQLAWRAEHANLPGAVPPGLPTCQQSGPMSLPLLQRAACDAVLQVVVLDRNGAIVEMRTPSRLANRAQRRALAARDRGCAWPGCSVPAAGCDAHHVQYWSEGGKTCLTNMCLLCPRHHTEIHVGEWRIVMRDGLPWFVPPRWVDPAQVPIRNNLHDHIAAFERLAQQLCFDTDPDPPGG